MAGTCASASHVACAGSLSSRRSRIVPVAGRASRRRPFAEFDSRERQAPYSNSAATDPSHDGRQRRSAQTSWRSLPAVSFLPAGSRSRARSVRAGPLVESAVRRDRFRDKVHAQAVPMPSVNARVPTAPAAPVTITEKPADGHIAHHEGISQDRGRRHGRVVHAKRVILTPVAGLPVRRAPRTAPPRFHGAAGHRIDGRIRG